jgi:hypothetical protein
MNDDFGFIVVLIGICLVGLGVLLSSKSTIETLPPVPHKYQVIIKSNGVETVWQVDGKRVRIEEEEQ